MKRGVVVEYNDDFVTLFTPDGQFLKATNKEGNYVLGEEISFFPSMDEREEAATRYKKRNFSDFNFRLARVGALSVLAIMFFMLSFLPFFNNDKVYAYMSIDINPSFEVGIDNQLKVISLEPLNEEAEELIENLPEWKNIQFNKIVDAIVDESKTEGFVYPGKEIVITTVINEEDKNVQTEFEKDINIIRTSYENEEMVVKTIETDKETREKAQKQGISMGKYVELQENANAVEEPKEDIQEPLKENQDLEEQDNAEENATTDKIEDNLLPNATIVNSQSGKNKLTSETKDKLKETKNKLKENAKKNDFNEKRPNLNEQINGNVNKDSNEAKNEKKNRENKENNRNNQVNKGNKDNK